MLDAKCKKKFHRYFWEYKNIHDVGILIFHFELYFNFPLINDALFFLYRPRPVHSFKEHFIKHKPLFPEEWYDIRTYT